MSARVTPKQTQRLDEISTSEAHFGEPWRGDTTDKSLVRRGLCRTYEVNGHPKIGLREHGHIWDGLTPAMREWLDTFSSAGRHPCGPSSETVPGRCCMGSVGVGLQRRGLGVWHKTTPVREGSFHPNALGRAVAEHGWSQS